MKNKIYVFAIMTHRKSYVNDAEECGDTMGYAVDKDINIIAKHYSSGINWTKHDMGISSDWKHDTYDEKFPNGYELAWIGGFENIDEAKTSIKKLIKD